MDLTSIAHDIVVIGASAGGANALQRLLDWLPGDLAAAVFIVQHRSPIPWEIDPLARLLTLKSPMEFHQSIDSEPVQPGRIYVAPPDRNISLENGLVVVDRSPKESHFRPNIDVLFRSAAMAYGRRVVGIVLSGMLQDGTAGLWQIRKRGGVTIAQDPRDAEFASMPQTAIDNLAVDFILPVEGIAQKLIALTREEDVDLPGRAEPVGVLLVGDAGPDARCLEERLPSFGYHVIGVARSGDEAVKIAQRERPDIVIMDVYMEQASGGITAGRKIWQELQVPVIYATAFSDPNTLNLVKNSANYGYLLKPFRPEAVDAAIQLALDRREKELRHLQT